MHAPAPSLFDQSALMVRAERLVKAARAAGADAADAVALRSLSMGIEVRDGAVEESESAESDDFGLRVLVGKRQAVVSSNDTAGDVATFAQRAVAMAKAAPEDKFAGLADEGLLARDFPDLDLIDPELPKVAKLEAMARAAEAAGLAVKGVAKSGGASASAAVGGIGAGRAGGLHQPFSAFHEGGLIEKRRGGGVHDQRSDGPKTASAQPPMRRFCGIAATSRQSCPATPRQSWCMKRCRLPSINPEH